VSNPDGVSIVGSSISSSRPSTVPDDLLLLLKIREKRFFFGVCGVRNEVGLGGGVVTLLAYRDCDGGGNGGRGRGCGCGACMLFH